MTMFSCFLFTALLWFVEASQVPLEGQCGGLAVPSQQDFDQTRYLGVWYEIQNTFTITKEDITCTRYTFSELPDGRLTVVTESKDMGLIDNPMRQSTLESHNATDAARMRGFIDVGVTDLPEDYEGDYVVVHTDYNCALVYYCLPLQDETIDDTAVEGFLILSRSSDPSEEQTRQCQDKFKELTDPDQPEIMNVKQNDCYAPVAAP